MVRGKYATLASLNTPRKTVANSDNLTHFIEPEERIPAKMKKVGTSPLASPSPPPPPTPPTPSSPDPPLGTLPGERQPSQILQRIWTGKQGEVIWSKIGPYKMFTADLQSLAPGKELESEIVNVYISSVLTMSTQKCHIIDTFQMTAIWDGTLRGMRKLDVMEWDVLIGAVCKDGHWTLVAMYPKEGRAVFIDPFGATAAKIQKCKDSTRAFKRKKMGNLSRWLCATIPHPRQQDLTSCGVIVCKIAELLLSGDPMEFDVTEEGINSIRTQMGSKLVEDSDDLTELCRFCGEESSPSDAPVDHWVVSLQIVGLNKTRNSLALDGTLSSIMTIKMADLEPCFKWEPPSDVLKASKKDTGQYNRAHRS
ncbi:unnamed protein product [Boreogadus saida]